MASGNPLAGVRVVEIGRFVTGPYCAQLLADLGADVLKVEDPDGGDPFRMWNRGAAGGYGPPFLAFNRNKRSISIDLKVPEGRDVLLRMVQHADALVENFAHGAMERLGLSYAVLAAANPQGRLIQPEEVAETVRWLCQPSQKTHTGQVFPVCGAEWIG